MKTKRKTKSPRSAKLPLSRRLALRSALGVFAVYIILSWIGGCFVHHPKAWLDEQSSNLPDWLFDALCYLGNPAEDLTNAIGLTGEDAVYHYEDEVPFGEPVFAGEPVRTGEPAPSDITVIDRGEFKIGWSPRLRHPVWVAYHVPPESKYDIQKRPNFVKDRSTAGSPVPADYTSSGYDRGHMAPNHAIASRFGEAMQKNTFYMTNIVPQSPQLNRGVWRDVEHRIADLWTRRWGEIWVIVGTISNGNETLSGKDIDVPDSMYQIVIAVDETKPEDAANKEPAQYDLRVCAMIFPQDVPWKAWPTRYLATIDEIEEKTGLDFFPDLYPAIQDPLEKQLPTRLFPISKSDLLKEIALRFD